MNNDGEFLNKAKILECDRSINQLKEGSIPLDREYKTSVFPHILPRETNANRFANRASIYARGPHRPIQKTLYIISIYTLMSKKAVFFIRNSRHSVEVINRFQYERENEFRLM